MGIFTVSGTPNYADLFASIETSDWNGVMAIESDSNEFAKSPDAFVSAAKVFSTSALESREPS